jgi:hypothetical protein
MTRLGAVALAVCIGLGGSGCTGCATALLEGVLVADGRGGLAIQATGGNVVPVEWPTGVGIGHDGDRLTITNWLGFATAHEGEFVSIGGGMAGDGPEFAACGPISVRAASTPP